MSRKNKFYKKTRTRWLGQWGGFPMGKVNKQWIESLQKGRHTIINIAYPKGVTTKNAFYDMEIQTIKW